MIVLTKPVATEVVANLFFFFQAEDGIRDRNVTGVQTFRSHYACPWESASSRSTSSNHKMHKAVMRVQFSVSRSIQKNKAQSPAPRQWPSPALRPPISLKPARRSGSCRSCLFCVVRQSGGGAASGTRAALRSTYYGLQI